MRGRALAARRWIRLDRIATLKSFIEARPDDPFPRYGLAMEYKNQGKLEEAARVFAELREKFADYVPQYLHGGHVLLALNRKAEARDVYRKGIEVATRRGDFHARGELEAALADLGPAEGKA